MAAAASEQYPNLNPYASPNSGSTTTSKNGPVADKARQEVSQTQNEFGNLASSRTTPYTQTATGQNLTHYHSFFYSLLSWSNPRATAISYGTIVFAILAFRYFPIAHYTLRVTWITLGVTAAAEIAGQTILGQGITSRLRPKKYYTLSSDTLATVLEDITEFLNFFVIEFQRLLFAENVFATVGAFVAALFTYFLIKITPIWGIALLFTTLIYFAPLAYFTNKELIDTHISNASSLINAQTQQLRDLASHHTNKAVAASSSAFKDYSARAQDIIGQSKSKGTASKAEEQLKGAPAAPTEVPTTAPTTQSAEPVAA